MEFYLNELWNVLTDPSVPAGKDFPINCFQSQSVA